MNKNKNTLIKKKIPVHAKWLFLSKEAEITVVLYKL